MLSAAARAVSTLLPSAMEPEESSTSVTLSGLPSSRSSGAWNAMRARIMAPSSGCGMMSVCMAKLSSLDGCA